MKSLERRKEAFKRFLAYYRQHELSIEFWDVHFCQGSSKNLHKNEKNKERKYRNAFRAFVDRKDKEFEDALDHMRFLNKGDGAPWVSLFGMCLSGALSDVAWKSINRLAKIKFPTPPYGYDNTEGTFSYLVARSRWADWWMRIIMRTMFGEVAKPITSGIELYRASVPTALPMDYATEADDLGPTGVSQIYDISIYERQSSYRFSRHGHCFYILIKYSHYISLLV